MQTAEAEQWLEACKKEINNLQMMECYRTVEKPSGCRTLKNKWVFKRKDMPGGEKSFKARVVITAENLLVQQVHSLRLTLAVVTHRGMKCRQGDETNAYIHADSDQTLHMAMLDGFDDNSGREWAIDKALYGMKQSALMWYLHFKDILVADGFKPTISDGCVFTKRFSGAMQIITIYVDDILVCAAMDAEIDRIFEHLQAHIRLNNMGPVAKLLGMDIYRDEDAMTMDVLQTTYIERMATKYGMQDAKPVDTPIPPGLNLTEDVGARIDNKPYRRIVGSLLYCGMATRPDILHMQMAKRVVAYLLHTKDIGLSYSGGRKGSGKLIGFADSSWADDRSTGKSTCRYLWMLGGWRCLVLDGKIRHIQHLLYLKIVYTVVYWKSQIQQKRMNWVQTGQPQMLFIG
ncbi:hypothetical protein AeRB84_005817 [Aphanomyces euteiches]|nr:hypothetical protein AeRB84_005817 [Aphanomyces euteiches]